MIVPFKKRLAEALVGPLAPPAVSLLCIVHSVHIRRRWISLNDACMLASTYLLRGSNYIATNVRILQGQL